jgi:hypothetical protein
MKRSESNIFWSTILFRCMKNQSHDALGGDGSNGACYIKLQIWKVKGQQV